VRFTSLASFVVSCVSPLGPSVFDFVNHALDALIRWPVYPRIVFETQVLFSGLKP
jgi:hypothetical protein